jgi:uncharacterized protein (TIGR02466 family)
MTKAYFPTLIYHSPLLAGRELKSLVRSLAKEADTYRSIDDEGQTWSDEHYVGGYTSYASLNNLHMLSPYFGELKDAIDKHVRKFTRKLEMDLSQGTLQMRTCWINHMPALTAHSLHLHPLSVISGTFYLATPAGSSALKFEDPRLANFMAAPPKIENASVANQRFISLQPKAGDLILFESWLRHEVPANRSQQARVSVSFNYEWV